MNFLKRLLGVAPERPHVAGQTVRRVALLTALPITGWPRTGKHEYAVVREGYLRGLVERTKRELSQVGGIRQWQRNATCTLYAAQAVALAGQEYYLAAFHDQKPAPALAVGEFWFVPAGSGEGHAVVVAYTENGVRFIDPQGDGRLLELTPGEVSSAYSVRFL